MTQPGTYHVKADYKRWHGMNGWHCLACNYCPTNTLGPPSVKCENCGEALYTSVLTEAALEIQVFRHRAWTGLMFKILRIMPLTYRWFIVDIFIDGEHATTAAHWMPANTPLVSSTRQVEFRRLPVKAGKTFDRDGVTQECYAPFERGGWRKAAAN